MHGAPNADGANLAKDLFFLKTKKILLIKINFRIIICLLMFVGRVAKERISS